MGAAWTAELLHPAMCWGSLSSPHGASMLELSPPPFPWRSEPHQQSQYPSLCQSYKLPMEAGTIHWSNQRQMLLGGGGVGVQKEFGLSLFPSPSIQSSPTPTLLTSEFHAIHLGRTTELVLRPPQGIQRLDQNRSPQGETFRFMKIPEANGICLLAKTSDSWPICKVPTSNLLKAFHTQTRRQ